MQAASSSSFWENYMEHFCQEQPHDDWNMLPPSTKEFLENLNLPKLHPYCSDDIASSYIYPMALRMGPPPPPFDDVMNQESLWSLMKMLWTVYGLPIMALLQLWAKLFAGYLAPAGVVYMAWGHYYNYRSRGEAEKISHEKFHSPGDGRILFGTTNLYTMTTLCLSWIILTDDQYVLAFGGRAYGFLLVMATLILSPRRFWRCSLLTICLLMLVSPPWAFHDPDIFPLISPGIYSNPDTTNIQSILNAWNVPDYATIGTPWQLTGDTRTGLPFLFNDMYQSIVGTNDDDRYSPIVFHRVWLETEDSEYIAFEIAFPPDGHDPDKPLYLVFHGLNGGSKEGYVVDFVSSRIRQGSTVVVMIARGLMDTPMLGWTFFHGVRISDAHLAASTLRERVLHPEQSLAGVGYSLGAIVLNHYVAAFDDRVALDVAVSISGALYCVPQKDFLRSKRSWQVVIAAHVREMFLSGKWGARLLHQLGDENYRKLLLASNIVDIDRYTGVMYNGYSNLTSFYQEMSALLPPDKDVSPVTAAESHHHHFAIPHLILQSFDDPVSTWKTNAENDPDNFLYPPNLVRQQENLVVMLTATGGHVGWPIGLMPHSWEYMNDMVAAGFVNAFDHHHQQQFNSNNTFTHQRNNTQQLHHDGNLNATCANIVGNSVGDSDDDDKMTTEELLETSQTQTEMIQSVEYGSVN